MVIFNSYVKLPEGICANKALHVPSFPSPLDLVERVAVMQLVLIPANLPGRGGVSLRDTLIFCGRRHEDLDPT